MKGPATLALTLLVQSSNNPTYAFQNPLSLTRQHPYAIHSIRSRTPTHATTMEPTPTGPMEQTPMEPTPSTKEEEVKQPEFDWFKSWYPLVPVEFLDTSKPHKFNLLGMDLCVWNDFPESDEFGPKDKKKKRKSDEGGTWRVFEDSCPHRKVPLSEGRVEKDGTLLCSYHGWRFEGGGSCVALPQEGDHDRLERIKANPMSKCTSFPVKVIDGILWVWADASEDAVLESELTPVPRFELPEEMLKEKDRLWYGPYNFRELPYGADYFLENVVDPSHVPVSHHNVVGDRYRDPKELKISNLKPLTKQGFQNLVYDGKQFSTQTFHAPCTVSLDAKLDDNGTRQILELMIAPSRPGFSYHSGRMIMIKDKDGKMNSAFKQFTLPLPKWVNHLMAAKFLNQDGLFLHAQERAFSASGKYKTSLHHTDTETTKSNQDYKQLVYTPTQADKGVILFREWLRLKAGGRIPFCGDATMPPVDNEAVFDQWDSHTSKCKVCQGALKKTRRVRLIAAALALSAAVWQPGGKVASTLSVAAFGGVGYLAHKLTKQFYRVEFSHAEND